jgi:hypothetical protein
MKKAYQVIVDVSFPVVVAVEADSEEEATAIGEQQAEQSIRTYLPERSAAKPYSYRFTARRAMELRPENRNA